MKRITIAVFSAVLVLSPLFAHIAGADPLPTNLALGQPSASILYLRVTAYSSSPDETDYDPFFTANGTPVHDGIVATNLLPFGTKIMIPALFGGKIFSVEDRMAKRLKETIDIWMPSKGKAVFFGVNYANVVVLGTSSIELAAK